jgi:acyl carrier protein
MEAEINAYISRELVTNPELLPLDNDTLLLESGILDSLSLLRMLVFLEEQFHISMDDFELLPENFNSVNAICAYIRSRQQSQVVQ